MSFLSEVGYAQIARNVQIERLRNFNCALTVFFFWLVLFAIGAQFASADLQLFFNSVICICNSFSYKVIALYLNIKAFLRNATAEKMTFPKMNKLVSVP